MEAVKRTNETLKAIVEVFGLLAIVSKLMATEVSNLIKEESEGTDNE